MDHRQPVERLSYGLDDAATAIGVSRRTVYDYIGSGRLKAVKLGGRRLIFKEDLLAFLAAARAEAA
jgi:excisionase family DNA binding protein